MFSGSCSSYYFAEVEEMVKDNLSSSFSLSADNSGVSAITRKAVPTLCPRAGIPLRVSLLYTGKQKPGLKQFHGL
jgi:hypothetical protein